MEWESRQVRKEGKKKERKSIKLLSFKGRNSTFIYIALFYPDKQPLFSLAFRIAESVKKKFSSTHSIQSSHHLGKEVGGGGSPSPV